MADRGQCNLQWSAALFDGLIAAGLRQVVLSPGSRSSPLVLACAQRAELQTWVRLDERSAAFFALGLAQQNCQPVVLVATSGTAPANWFPAVIEADMAELPLVLISADRPPEAQDWAANQTTDQTHLFGRHVRAFHDPGAPTEARSVLQAVTALGKKAIHQALWPRPGPVHLNLPFREPLIPEDPDWRPALPPSNPAPIIRPRLVPEPAQAKSLRDLISEKPGILVCGPSRYPQNFAQAVNQLAKQLACPILADPLSNLRFNPSAGTELLTQYDAFLRHPEFPAQNPPGWILRFGRPPVSRVLSEYLVKSSSADHWLVAEFDWPDPWHRTDQLIRADATLMCQALLQQSPDPAPSDWMPRFQQAELRGRQWQASGCDEDQPFEGDVIEDLLARLPPHSRIFCGNSLPIRQMDTWSGHSRKPLTFHCNRGASGIDGNVSTLLGLAAGAQGAPVIGLIGDLTLLHDLNGLLPAKNQDLVLIVLHNGGGGIFGYLPQARSVEFERYWLTPEKLDLGQVALLYGCTYQRILQQSEFAPALSKALEEKGPSLIEVVIDRAYSQRRHMAYWDAVAGQPLLGKD